MQIKKITSARADFLSDSYKSVRIPRNKKAKTGILRSNKYPKKAHRHHDIHHYCVLCKKAGIPKRKYTSHSAKDFNSVHTNRNIKDGMGVSMVIRTDAVKQYKKSEKRKKELKALKK